MENTNNKTTRESFRRSQIPALREQAQEMRYASMVARAFAKTACMKSKATRSDCEVLLAAHYAVRDAWYINIARLKEQSKPVVSS